VETHRAGIAIANKRHSPVFDAKEEAMASSDRTSTSGNTPTKTTSATPQQRPSDLARTTRQQSGAIARRDPFGSFFSGTSPFGSLFQRWNDEMDRFFDDLGLGRTSLTRGEPAGAWSPQIEVLQRGNDLVVRADLPGMNKDDVHVNIADDVLTIQGERRNEHEEEHEGWYRNERSYGSFYRTIPLPEGTIADSAKASFKNGVLEVTLQAPPREVNRGRKVEIE